MEGYDEDIIKLIRHRMIGDISDRGQLVLDAWLDESEDHRELFETISKEIQSSREMPLFCQLDDEKAWQEFELAVRQKVKARKRVYWHRAWKYAAMLAIPVALSVTLGIWQTRHTGELSPRVEEIQPGSSKAILISSDGRVHELAEGKEEKIEVEKGIVVERLGGKLVYDSVASTGVLPVMNALKIPRGGEFRITLSDGTRVYMNSATELRYPVAFNEKERTVYLSGEAYFEVAKDKERPFYVKTDEMQIRVYGTEFNVNTYRQDGFQAVLVNGEVGIKNWKVGGDELIMRPGELACWDGYRAGIEIKKVDVQQYIAWKNGYFAFENESLEQIMSTLSLWYDVDVFFQSELAKKLVFTGYMKRYDQINEILAAIMDVVKVKFTINGQTIIVSK